MEKIVNDKWQPFFDQNNVKLELNSEIIDRLNQQLDMANHGRRKGKLRLSDMLSHWLLEMGSKPPKIEKVEPTPENIDVTLFGLASEYLDKAASKNNTSKEAIVEYLLNKYEGSVKRTNSKKRQGATTTSIASQPRDKGGSKEKSI